MDSTVAVPAAPRQLPTPAYAGGNDTHRLCDLKRKNLQRGRQVLASYLYRNRNRTAMIFGMSEVKLQSFLERISATAIANQAVLKCLALGVPATPYNVIFYVGDFVDPSKPQFQSLILQIDQAIDDFTLSQSEPAPLNG